MAKRSGKRSRPSKSAWSPRIDNRAQYTISNGPAYGSQISLPLNRPHQAKRAVKVKVRRRRDLKPFSPLTVTSSPMLLNESARPIKAPGTKASRQTAKRVALAWAAKYESDRLTQSPARYMRNRRLRDERIREWRDLVCHDRQTRKEVIHATGKAGKRGKQKPRQLTLESKVKC